MGLGFLGPTAISLGLNLVVSLFTPPLKNKAPERNSQVPRSSYNSPILLPVGLCRVEGNKFFPDTIEQMYRDEIKTKKQGKGLGGGAETEVREVFGTFAVVLCQGRTVLDKVILNGREILPTDDYFTEYITFFDGDQTAPWSAIQNIAPPPLNEIGYLGISYLGFFDLPLSSDDFGGRIPQQVSAVLYNADLGLQPSLDAVVQYICNRAGLLNEQIDVTELASDTLIEGFLIEESGEGYRAILEELMQFFLFTAFEDQTGKIVFKKLNRGSEPVIILNDKDYIVSEQGGSFSTFIKRKEQAPDLTSKLIVKFNNVLKNFFPDEIPEYFNTGARKKKSTEINFSLNTYPDIVREKALLILRYLTLTQQFTYEFTIATAVLEETNLDLLSPVQLTNGEIVQVQQINFNDNYTVDIIAKIYVADLNYNYSPDTPPLPGSTPLLDPPIPDLYMCDTTRWSNDPPNTLYFFATGACTIEVGNSVTQYSNTVDHNKTSTIGTVDTALPSVPTQEFDWSPGSSFDITLDTGSVEGVGNFSDPEFINGKINLALLAKLKNGVWQGEFIQFGSVASLGNNQFRLSQLNRGLFKSYPLSEISPGDRFFLFNDAVKIAYYSLITGETFPIGLYARVIVKPWQDLGSTPVTNFTPDGLAYKPEAVTSVVFSQDSEENILLNWEAATSYSLYNDGLTNRFEIDVIQTQPTVVNTYSVDGTEFVYLASDRLTDGVTFPFDMVIYAISDVTGRGYPATATIIEDLSPDDVVFTGTSVAGGIRGIRYIEGTTNPGNVITYIVPEEDNNYQLIVRNASATAYTNLSFDSSLPVGFEVYVLNQPDNPVGARIKIQTPEFLPDPFKSDLLKGGTCIVTHVGAGRYTVTGNSERLIQVDAVAIDTLKSLNFTSADDSVTITVSQPNAETTTIDLQSEGGGNGGGDASIEDIVAYITAGAMNG